MTRRDYVLIANALKLAWDRGNANREESAAEMHEDCFNSIANALQSDNPCFDRDNFYSAVYERKVSL